VATLTVEQLRAIDLCKEKLVKRAEELLDDANFVQMSTREFGHSQIRNLIAVALETESPSVVTNFIRYQMGREKHPKGWRNRSGDLEFGKRLIDELDNGVITEELADIPGTKGDETSTQLARMELLRHFLGFVSRYMKYLDLQRQ